MNHKFTKVVPYDSFGISDLADPLRHELTQVGPREYRYGPWRISHWLKPIPPRNFDWDWCHEDYDGAEDANDHRCGSNPSLVSAIEEIHECEDEQ